MSYSRTEIDDDYLRYSVCGLFFYVYLGICSLETEENKNFDTIFYPSGIRNSRIYFRFTLFSNIYLKQSILENVFKNSQ